MTQTEAPVQQPDYGRAGRDLKASIISGVVLLALVGSSLLLFKTAFMVIVAAAVVAAIWELHRGLKVKDIDLPEQPLMVGGVAMVLVAYFWGAPTLVTVTAVAALVTMLWLLRRGVEGYLRTVTASVFTLLYVPFLGSFVTLLLSEGGDHWARSNGHFVWGVHDDGVKAVIAWVLATVLSDIGGYCAGVLFGKHPMAPIISPKKSWEGFAGSLVFTIAGGIVMATLMLDSHWYIGLALGVIAALMATLGDLVESVIKRDLGVKDMSNVIPGHGGVMDRLDSLLATVAPIWLLLHYTVFNK